MKITFYVVAWLAFTAFTLEVAFTHGLVGFIPLALREPWGMQMLIDLFICFGVAVAWIRRDAPAYGISPWPYVAATVLLGSVGLGPYLIHRELVRRSARAPQAAVTA